MSTESTQSPARQRSVQWRSRRSLDRARRIGRIAIAVSAFALLLVAVARAPAIVEANNNRCLRQIANDEHTSLEAFFQNPVEQDALAQAIAACSR